MLTKTQQFTAAGATTWTAVSGTVTSAGLYTAPSTMPAAGTDTVTASNSAGQSSATVTLLTNVTPTVTATGASPLPLGVFTTTVTGTGFTAQSQAQLTGIALTTTYVNPTTLTIAGFAGPATTENLTVSNGTLVSAPLAVPVGVQNPQVSVSAALSSSSRGLRSDPPPLTPPTSRPSVLQAWLNQQLALPVISNYNSVTGLSQAAVCRPPSSPTP